MTGVRIVGSVAAVLLVGACASAPPPAAVPSHTPTPTASPISDGVPLPVGARLASGPTATASSGNATGWTAVAAFDDPHVDAEGAARKFADAAGNAHWTVGGPLAASDGSWTVSATSAGASPGSGTWVSVSTLNGRGGGGAALIYRVASAK